LARANVAAGTSDIFDIELLSEMLTEFLGGDPSEDIGAAAGSEWHNHAHRTRRIGFRRCRPRRNCHERGSTHR